MSKTRSFFALGVIGLCASGLALSLFAQDDGQPPPGRGRGNFDPAQFQKRMMDRLKETLKASDDDWKALSPKVEKVMAATRDARFGGGFGGGFGGAGGPGGGRRGGQGQKDAKDSKDAAPQSPIAKASSELQKVVEDSASSKDDIEKKLTALRSARSAARDELQKAQKDLRELLTQRQEATLVLQGMLD